MREDIDSRKDVVERPTKSPAYSPTKRDLLRHQTDLHRSIVRNENGVDLDTLENRRSAYDAEGPCDLNEETLLDGAH